MGQIQVNSPQIGSSDFINSIAAWEFRGEFRILAMLYWGWSPIESYKIFNDNFLRVFLYSIGPCCLKTCAIQESNPIHLGIHLYRSPYFHWDIRCFCSTFISKTKPKEKPNFICFWACIYLDLKLALTSNSYKEYLHNTLLKAAWTCFVVDSSCINTWVSFKKQNKQVHCLKSIVKFRLKSRFVSRA